MGFAAGDCRLACAGLALRGHTGRRFCALSGLSGLRRRLPARRTFDSLHRRRWEQGISHCQNDCYLKVDVRVLVRVVLLAQRSIRLFDLSVRGILAESKNLQDHELEKPKRPRFEPRTL